jgi:hypothetical protein
MAISIQSGIRLSEIKVLKEKVMSLETVIQNKNKEIDLLDSRIREKACEFNQHVNNTEWFLEFKEYLNNFED